MSITPPNEKNEPDIRPSDPPPLSPEISELLDFAEEQRVAFMRSYRTRQNITMSIMILCALGAGSAFAWYFLVEAKLMMALAWIAPCIIPPVLSSLWSRAPLQAYERYYKEVILPKMARSLGNLSYAPKRGISQKILRKTAIMPNHTKYHAEDCFSGTYKQAKIIFSEARLYTNENKTVFDGIFVLLELPKPRFKGLSILTADPDLSARAQTKLQDVDLSSNNFALGLHALTSDPANATLLQNQHLIKEFHEMIALFDRALCSMSFFAKRHVFIMIPYTVNMFEACDIRFPIASRAAVSRCVREVEQVQSIIDILSSLKDEQE